MLFRLVVTFVALTLITEKLAWAQETQSPKQEATFQREQLNPQARVAFEQGLEFLKAKDYKKAINAFGSAAKMHPRHGQFRHLLGVAYIRNKQGGPAWLQFRKAVLLNPRYEPAIRDFESTWSLFHKQGAFVSGRRQEDIARLIGEPDAKGGTPPHEVWQYGFMRLQFAKSQLVGVVDPRGAEPDLKEPSDSIRPEFDDPNRWKLGHREWNRLHELSEYVPNGESVLQWTEMYQLQRLHKLAARKSPSALMHGIRERLLAANPKVRFGVLAESDQEALFQWNTPGSKNQPPQHEIVRLVRGERDVHRLAYTRKIAQIPQQEAQRWLDLLQKPKLLPPEVQSSGTSNE